MVDGVDAALAAIREQPHGSRVVLVGGDGTVHRMLPALRDRQAEMGLVPMGSGNDLARAMGVAGRRWEQALAHALDSPAAPMDLGELRCNGQHLPFASSLTAGFDSAVGARALRGPRSLHGLPRYLWATLGEVAALRNWPVVLHDAKGGLLHDGPALMASVLNTPSYGSGMPAVPHAQVADGHLDLLVAGRFGRRATLAMLPRLLAGRHLSHPRVRCHAFTALHAQAREPLPLAADGEDLGPARAWSVHVLPAALRVVPARPFALPSPSHG